MMKKLFLFSFILFVFLLPSVVSAEEQKIGLTYLNNSEVIISNDMGADIQLVRNTTNQNQLDIRTMIFTSNYNFKKNVLYEYEIETSNSYITNNTNKVALKGYNMSCQLISIQGYNTNYLRVRFTCPNDTSYILLSLSNLSGQNITTGYAIGWNSIYLWQITDTVDIGPIINNDNQNTQNIIDNNTQNTQDIIDNNNQNTQDIINSNLSCNLINENNIIIDNKSLNTSGQLVDNSNFGITDFININGYTTFTGMTSSAYGSASMCFYDINKDLISCNAIVTVIDRDVTVPSNAYYFRSSIDKRVNKPIYKLCKNGNQAIGDSINNLDNTISDSSIGSSASDGASFLNNFTTDTFGLTAIITAPLSLIQSITSSSCSTLNLPLPYLNNKYLTLPCMSSIYQQYFGTLFTLYQTITFGVIAYWVCIRIFNLVKDFKNPEHDEIEVMDL